jgi:hypothetical protein
MVSIFRLCNAQSATPTNDEALSVSLIIDDTLTCREVAGDRFEALTARSVPSSELLGSAHSDHLLSAVSLARRRRLELHWRAAADPLESAEARMRRLPVVAFMLTLSGIFNRVKVRAGYL